MKKLCLAILDGYGINETLPLKKEVNEGQSLICDKESEMPNFFFSNIQGKDAVQTSSNAKFKELLENNPHTLLIASGEGVGLPGGQMGNSEVGHLNIGAGKIVLQDLLKISKKFEKQIAQKNKNLLDFFSKTGKGKHHILGLISNGNVHSSLEHLKHLVLIAKNLDVDANLHLITDGRDSDIFSGQNFIKEVEDMCENSAIKLVSVSGRYYAMDRENNQDRTEKYFNEITNASKTNDHQVSILEYVKNAYSNNVTDEFILPFLTGGEFGIENDDKILFFNFRADRMRQIVQMFREKTNCELFSFTEYSKDFVDVKVVFESELQGNTISEIISRKQLTQLKVAEVSKYAHVTYFLNGGKEEPFENEDRVLVEMVDIPTFDLKPEMSATQVSSEVINGMEKGYDFICVNYANCDMVGHTGNFVASQKAVETVTSEIVKLYEHALENDYILVVTADHGNAEIMENNGKVCTTHTTNRVPFAILNVKKKFNLANGGALCNIAPTIFELMELN